MKSLLLALALVVVLVPRPAGAHWSISFGFPLPVVPVAPAPCAPYVYYPPPFPVYYGALYPYPPAYVGFGYGLHRFGQPRYFDGWRSGGYRRPTAHGYTFR